MYSYLLIRYLVIAERVCGLSAESTKVHHQATPRLGGASVLISFLLVVFFAVLTVLQLSKLLWGNDPVIGSIIFGSIEFSPLVSLTI